LVAENGALRFAYAPYVCQAPDKVVAACGRVRICRLCRTASCEDRRPPEEGANLTKP
jgi:hypothetical protein